jgi:K+-sensing histidine kinase KdpD
MREENFFYASGGPLAAILLGIALIPLRGLTPAANFTLVFMAVTITVAEFGGRAAALATALASALSLNFFLTKPYLRLTIDNADDIIAFVGLTVCGLIAAAFGSRRGRRISELQAALQQLQLLHSASLRIEQVAVAEPELARILEASRTVLPVAAAALRDTRGYAVAAAGRALELPVPAQIVELDRLFPTGGEPAVGLGRLPLPAEGARLPLRVGDQQVGWLDVWGNGTPASIQSRHVLSDLARLLAVALPR